jgi:hypothetical protein
LRLVRQGDNAAISDGDVIGESREQLRSLRFWRDRDWSRSKRQAAQPTV